MESKSSSKMTSSESNIRANKKALTRQSELENTLLVSNIFSLNFTSSLNRRQRFAKRVSRFKRHLLHRTSYLTYWGK